TAAGPAPGAQFRDAAAEIERRSHSGARRWQERQGRDGPGSGDWDRENRLNRRRMALRTRGGRFLEGRCSWLFSDRPLGAHLSRIHGLAVVAPGAALIVDDVHYFGVAQDLAKGRHRT